VILSFAPVTADFDVERGLEVSGRVVDRDGHPVKGEVHYAPVPDNPHLKDFNSLGRLLIIVSGWHRVGADGRLW